MRILIVEDSRVSAALLSQLLRKENYETRVVDTVAAALVQAAEGWADIVLLDRELPDGDGLDLCRQLKADARTQHLPLAFITARQDEDSAALALNSGALDYITKPFRPMELLARVGVLARIKRAEDEVRRLTHRDPLTGLYNRRFLEERLPEEIARARRYREPLCCLLADVDRFKQINDSHGHPFGDRALVAVSRVLEQGLRSTDLIVRWGGDEFLAILPHTDARGAATSAERVVNLARALDVQDDGESCRITLSVGVASFRDRGSEPRREAEVLLGDVDRCLYEAKHGGRDRLVLQAAASTAAPSTRGK